MVQFNTTIDDKIMEEFREIVYKKTGLRKGDVKESIEEALMDYIKKHRSK